MRYQIIPVTPYQQNCTLIWCEETKRAAVIDPGGELHLIKAAAEQAGVEIEKILITHAHLDHAGGAADLAEMYDVPIEGPEKEDQFWIDSIAEQGKMLGLPDTKSFIPTRWLNDEDRVSVGNVELEVYHCPGHTPGHVIFYQRDDQLAFVGDVLFMGSVGRTDFPRGDFATLANSIRTKLWPLGDEVKFVSGHGPMSNFGLERKTNPFVGDGVS